MATRQTVEKLYPRSSPYCGRDKEIQSPCPWFATYTTRPASSWTQIMATQTGFPCPFRNVVIGSISLIYFLGTVMRLLRSSHKVTVLLAKRLNNRNATNSLTIVVNVKYLNEYAKPLIFFHLNSFGWKQYIKHVTGHSNTCVLTATFVNPKTRTVVLRQLYLLRAWQIDAPWWCIWKLLRK